MKAEKILLTLLLLLLPSQLGYHFWPEWSLINGIRVDYLSPTVYLTDLIIGSLLLFNLKLFKVPGVLIILAVLNTFFSLSPLVTLYKWVRIYEYFWLFRYLTINFNWKLRILNWTLPLAILWTAGIAWGQFLLQHSLGGPSYWVGERTFSISTPGIAKIFLGFGTWEWGLILRSYATLPHPNALAGWLIVASYLVGRKSRLVAWLTVSITFSRSALAVLTLYLWRWSRFGVVVLLALCFALFANLGNPDSWIERVVLVKSALSTISAYPVFGVGLGNFVSTVPSLRQPVHNIYLLLAAELGISSLLVICYAIFVMGRKKLSIINWQLRTAIISVLILGLVDHYWLTSHQNILLLVVLVSLVKITSNATKNS